MIEHYNKNGKLEEQYSNFWVIKNKLGDIKKFEAAAGAWINYTVRDVLNYLWLYHIDGQFILLFNDIKLKVSAFMSENKIVKEYFNKLEKLQKSNNATKDLTNCGN